MIDDPLSILMLEDDAADQHPGDLVHLHREAIALDVELDLLCQTSAIPKPSIV